jgi:hypothetical protein
MQPQAKDSAGQPPAQTQDTKPAAKPNYYARKDTLKVNGNVIMGNWFVGTTSGVCEYPNGGTPSLLLSDIASISDLVPCPKGSSIVMAVMK